jgi:protease-4
MKGIHNLLLQLRKEWFLDPAFADQLMPLAYQLAAGTLQLEERGLLMASYANGTSVNALPYAFSDAKDPFEELPEGSIAIIPVRGTMLKNGTLCAWGADELTELMLKADNSPKMSGTILLMDSGGGAVNSVPVWTQALAERKKPVVTIADMCCSAAYYAAIHTDHIMAINDLSATFGSIGVMVRWLDYAKAMEKMGIEEREVYADQSGHKNKEMQDAKKGEYELLKANALNPLAIRFQNDVKARRPKLDLSVEGIIEGKTFGAQDALANGLIDSIGTLADAIAMVGKLQATKTLNSLL